MNEQAHRKTHNKTPGSRKQRKSPADKGQKSAAANKTAQPTFEMVALIKDEELDLNYEDDTYEEEEEEFITS